MTAPRDDREAGMTLIELVIATALLMVVIVPVTAAFLLGFLESESSRARTTDSASAQIASSYLTTDLNSADTVRRGSATCTSPAITPATPQLDLAWTDPRTNVASAVSYVSYQEPGKSLQLVRLECAGSPPALQRTVAVVRNLDPTGTIAVTCDGALCPLTPASPKKVRVKLTARATTPQAQSSYEPLALDIEVRRRSGS